MAVAASSHPPRPSGSSNRCATPSHIAPKPQIACRSSPRSYERRRGTPEAQTSAACAATSPSRHPPLTAPANTRDSASTSNRAPGCRYDEPSTACSVARASGTVGRSVRAWAAARVSSSRPDNGVGAGRWDDSGVWAVPVRMDSRASALALSRTRWPPCRSSGFLRVARDPRRCVRAESSSRCAWTPRRGRAKASPRARRPA